MTSTKVRRRARALPRALLPRVDEGIEARLGDEPGTSRRHVAHQLRKHALRQRIGFDLVLGSEAHEARRVDQRAGDRALEQTLVREMRCPERRAIADARRRSPT